MTFFKSFQYAFCGLIQCIKNERNMRFHTVAALYVLIFARFFHFSREEWALLILLIGAVIAAEAINTSIETLCNKVTKERDPYIRIAKDAAAGAVLILAIAAVVIGILFFGNADGWREAYRFYLTHPLHLGALIILTVFSPLYIFALPHRNSQTQRKGKKK